MGGWLKFVQERLDLEVYVGKYRRRVEEVGCTNLHKFKPT